MSVSDPTACRAESDSAGHTLRSTGSSRASAIAGDPLVTRLITAAAIIVSLMVLAMASWPATGVRFHAAETALHDLVVSTVPGPIMPIAARGAEVLLTPWLYLVMLICFLAERYFPARSEQRFLSAGFVQDPRHRDKSFAVVFSLWDRLLGTQWHDHTEYPDTGIRDRGFPHEQSTSPAGALRDYGRQMIYPFRAVWNACMGRGWEIDGPDTSR